METVEVSTVVYLPPREVYDFLVDVSRYAEYSKHLEDVRRHGSDGCPGTRYDITLSWSKLSYTARSRVTDVDPPNRIDWRLVRDVDARGYWQIESEPESAPGSDTPASRVRLFVEFAPDSAGSDALGLPPFVPLDWLVDRVEPTVRAEAQRVVERVVADLEGRPRAVDLDVHRTPNTM